MHSFVPFIGELIRTWGVLGVFIASILEEVFAPIPSTLVMSFTGAIFLEGLSGSELYSALFFKVALPASLGFTVGSYVLYGLFYILGKPGVLRYGKYFSVSWDDIERFSLKMKRSFFDETLLFLARAAPFVPGTAINIFCGIIRWNPLTYGLVTFFGSLIRALILGYAGFLLGRGTGRLVGSFNTLSHEILFGTIIFSIISFFFFFRWKKKRQA